MIPPAVAVLLAGVLLLSALLGMLVLLRSRTTPMLRTRLAALRQAPATPIEVLPNIRVGGVHHGAASRRLLTLLRYDPEIPPAHRIAWPVVLLVSLGGGAVLAALVGRIFDSHLALPAFPPAALFVARTLFGWQQARYRETIFVQIPDTIGHMVRAIRAGLPMAEAVRGISREMPPPTRGEFTRVVGDLAIGRPLDQALARLHERTGLTEYAFLAVTIGLQTQTGGSLAETLENLADIVRKRVAMANRAKALAGEAKAQAGLLIILPVVAAIGMSFLQPFFVSTFTEDPAGQRLALIGLFLMVLGIMTIRWLIRQAGRD